MPDDGYPDPGPATRRLAEFVAAKKGLDPDELEGKLLRWSEQDPQQYRSMLMRERYRILLAFARQIPVPNLRGSHSVPYGSYFRQWMTDGSLVVWVNRGEAIDQAHGDWPNEGFDVFGNGIRFSGPLDD